MATIDLGRIKQVFRGTYNNATAYVPDDLVVFTDTGITSTYICTTASTGNNPSSGGTAHGNWAYIAKGVTDPIPSQSGNTGKFLKTDGSSLSFADVQGGVLGMKQTITSTHHAISMSSTGWTSTHNDFAVTYTAKSTTSHFLLEAFLSLGFAHHDMMATCNWWDSLKGLSDGNELFELSGASGNRKRGTFALLPSGAGVSGSWDEYWFTGHFISALYYPDAGQRSTSQRTFKPVFRRNDYNYNLLFNYSKEDNGVGLTGTSIIRVTEIDGGIVG